ncbi:alpha/beta fold hydrolase [Nocardia sp. CDC159]|uniref:Thioesterase TesA n=1 Tax=Nocardia pulmonis TaxID=2951408 RepID=A0A9X2E5Q6_9NOCA|nr:MULTISPECIES: alpha/beta fold hydrolase [Nocardia]MCM6774304.1 alpha/beta fold hydrolase [Nocardia pulmonis]MCM6787630.1 alpha/beta fold hydrolase [Nocardia sp. CDC159]
MRTTSEEVAVLLRPAAATPAITLICLPYAGGSHEIFRPWAQELSDNIELVSLALPGRGRRIFQRAHRDWESLIRYATDGLAPYRDRTHAFYGHSFGARLAFELIQNGAGYARPTRLFVSGSRSPRSPQRRPFMHTMDERDFRSAVKQLGGTPSEILDNPTMMKIFSPTIRADIELAELWGDRHAGRPISAPITALYGRTDPIDTRTAMSGWSAHTSGGFEIVEMPGGHFFPETHRDALLDVIVDRLGVR